MRGRIDLKEKVQEVIASLEEYELEEMGMVRKCKEGVYSLVKGWGGGRVGIGREKGEGRRQVVEEARTGDRLSV